MTSLCCQAALTDLLTGHPYNQHSTVHSIIVSSLAQTEDALDNLELWWPSSCHQFRANYVQSATNCR